MESVEAEISAVKLQSAYFERLGPPGAKAYADLMKDAAELGLPTIADTKRGDIGPVAGAYAEAHLCAYGATCVTVNPYMGEDTLVPFLKQVRRLNLGGGIFALVATSNPSAVGVQNATNPPLYEVVAKLIRELGEKPGKRPDLGAVVGVTRPEIGRRVREILPREIFLSPGYGAQGGGVSGVKPLLDERGGGVLVNSSRGILYAYEESGTDYRDAARGAARAAKRELQSIGAHL